MRRYAQITAQAKTIAGCQLHRESSQIISIFHATKLNEATENLQTNKSIYMILLSVDLMPTKLMLTI